MGNDIDTHLKELLMLHVTLVLFTSESGQYGRKLHGRRL